MKWFPKSLRWRLQIWYGLILLVVLAAFGVTADRLDRARQFRQIDQELQQRISVLAGALRPGPPRDPRDPRDPREPRERPSPGLGGEGGVGPGPGVAGRGTGEDDERNRPGPPWGIGMDRPAPGDPHNRPFLRREIRLLPEDAGLFDRGNPAPFYYVIWVRDGRLHSHSTTAPMPIARPERVGAAAVPSVRTRGLLRETYLFVGPNDCVLVGRSIAPDLQDMAHRTGWLVVIGAGILVIGLAGGWWLASRAIRPLETISATAANISAGDLSQRISSADTESELGQLAGVLNSTFARLEAAFAQQTRFTSDAAHELRTPVTVILTQVQMALSRDRSAADYRETLEACQRAAQRMRRLIESLLALARFDAARDKLQRTPLDLATTVAENIELVRPLAADRDIRIDAELPELRCVGDGERLGQVITNLLTNAIQYNRPGGSVRVTGRRRDVGSIEVAVTDTGPGIAPEDLPFVFDRFYRADRSRTGSANAGLGLAISRAIVEAHGGTIECRSEPGVGTTFVFTVGAAPGAE